MKKINFISMLLTALFLLPWSGVKADQLAEGFEGATFAPEGWTNIHVSGNAVWSRNTATTHSYSDGSARVNNSLPGENYLITPKLKPESGESLTFYVKINENANNTALNIKVSTSTAEASSFTTTLITYNTGSKKTNPLSTSWTQKTINLSSYEGQEIYIAFHAVDAYGASNIFIDDVAGVTIATDEPATSCAKPKNLTKSDDTPEGATFTWEQNTDETTYQWACVASGAEVTEWNTLDENVRTKTVTGLTAGTAYDFHVRSYCGAGEGEQSASAKSTFTPTCPAPTAPVVSGISANGATLSWTEAAGISNYQYIVVASGDAQDWNAPTLVEGATTATLTGLNPSTNYDVYVRSYYSATTQSTAVKASFQTACGAVTIPFTWDFSDLGCWTTYNCNSNTGLYSGAFRFRWGDPGQYLISPEFVALSSTVDVKFDYRAHSTTYPETFALGYSTTTSDVASFTWLSDETVTNTTYAQYEKTLPAGVKYIAIQCKSNNQYYLYIDNFRIEETPSCVAPTALNVTDITTNSASVSWTSEAASFALEYKKTSDEQWTAATGTIASPFALEGLTQNETEYTVRVKAICGENNESEWIELDTPFKTDCEAKTVTEETAWTENFEAQTVDQAPACWYLPTPNDSYYYAKVINSDAKESTQCLDIRTYSTSSEIIVLPEFNEPIEHLNISFDYKNVNTGSRYGYLEVGYYSGSTFTLVGEALSKNENYTASGVIEMPKNGVPTGARMAFRLVGVYSGYTSHAYIDNLVVSRKPACAIPTNLQAVATSTGATLTWTAGDEETQWNIRYRVKDADTWTVLENKTSGFALTGLEIGTAYELQVQANCGDELSDWSDEITFTTNCSSIDALPYYADFTQALSSCWVVFAQNESYYKPTVNTAMQQLTMNGGKDGSSNNVVVMPPFSADLTNAVISLEYSCSTGANYAQLEVGYLTDKADAASFQALQTLDRNGSWTEARVAAATVPANAYIALRYAGASSHGDLAIRNLRVIEALTTGIDQTPFPSGEGRGEASKLLRNGILYIERNGNIFNVLGQPVD